MLMEKVLASAACPLSLLDLIGAEFAGAVKLHLPCGEQPREFMSRLRSLAAGLGAAQPNATMPKLQAMEPEVSLTGDMKLPAAEVPLTGDMKLPAVEVPLTGGMKLPGVEELALHGGEQLRLGESWPRTRIGDRRASAKRCKDAEGASSSLWAEMDASYFFSNSCSSN